MNAPTSHAQPDVAVGATEPAQKGASSAAHASAPTLTDRIRATLDGQGLKNVRDGRWFRRMLEQHAVKHVAHTLPGHWDAIYPGKDNEERAELHAKHAARKASAAGALASAAAGTGEMLSVMTDGLGAPIGLPIAIGSMVAEAAYTALVQLDLATDIASMYGVPFGHDVEEMSTLFSIALGTELSAKKKEAEHAEPERTEGASHKKEKGLLTRLMELEDGEIATRIGRKMLEEAVLRNVVPVIGVAISARWNYVATINFGEHVQRYVRYRRALDAAFSKLALDDVKDPALFIEGAWLLATADGEATREELQAVARIVDRFPGALSDKLDPTGGEDSEPWFAKIAGLDDALDLRLLDVLMLVAAIDKELSIAERRFLRRVGGAIKRDIDFARIERACRYLRDGDDLPEGFFGNGRATPA